VPLISTGVVRLHVQVLGEGAPVVCLHGLLVGSLATWYFSAAPRLARHFRVILYDLRGHGRSDAPARGYDLETQLRDLDAVLEACGVEGPVALVGHSFGGVLALHHALRRPASVAALALVEAPLPPSPARLVPAGAREARAILEHLPGAVRETLAGGGRRGQRLLTRVAHLIEGTDLLPSLEAMGDVEDEALSALDVPALAVYGEASICRATGERLAALLPRATLRVLPGGHFLPVEAPAAVTRAVATFLEEIHHA
jgi:pimeloyl-ACP methyl ester carboxylesterase